MIYEVGIAIILFIASIIDIKTREVPNIISYGFMTFVILIAYNNLYGNAEIVNLAITLCSSIAISLIIIILSKFVVVKKFSLLHIYENKTLSLILLVSIIFPIIYYIIYSGINPFNYYIGFFVATIVGMGLYLTGQWGGGDVKLLMALGIYFGITFDAIPKFLVYFVLMFLAGGVIGIYYSIYNAIKNFKEFKSNAKHLLAIKKVRIIRLIVLMIAIVIIVFGLSKQDQTSYLYFGIGFIIWLGFYVWILVKCVEGITLIKQKKISELVEGDWLVSSIKVGTHTVKPREIGLTLKDIEILKKSKLDTVIIKEGLPFVPSFFIAFILLEFFSLGLSF